jgi:hypothetical protein
MEGSDPGIGNQEHETPGLSCASGRADGPSAEDDGIARSMAGRFRL